MYCVNCGTQLSDSAKFCFNCGFKTKNYSQNQNEAPLRMAAPSAASSLVAAKCTGCGGALQVDPNLKAANCPYCGCTYYVEQAINNYNISLKGNIHVENATINIAGASADNYLKRAEEFLARGHCKEAVEYYEKVLDLDFENEVANSRIKAIKDYTFYSDKSIMVGFSSPLVELKYEKLVVTKNVVLLGPTKTEYYIQHFSFKRKGGLLSEDEVWYNGTKLDWTSVGSWKKRIVEAQNGIYPIMTIGSTLGEDYRAEKNAIFEYTKNNARERVRLLQELGRRYGIFDSNYNIQSELANGEEGYFLLVTLAYLELSTTYNNPFGRPILGGWKNILDRKDYILEVLNKYHLVEGNEESLRLTEKLRNSKYNLLLNTKPQGTEINDLVSFFPGTLRFAKKKYGV